MKHILAVDLGTSALKVLLIQINGEVISQGQAAYPTQHRLPGYAEQAPEDWWQALRQAIAQMRQSLTDMPSIVAIGVSGQMHGTVLLDENQAPLESAIIWSDRRSQAQVEQLLDAYSQQYFSSHSGNLPDTGFQLGTLPWLQEHAPDLWQRVQHILLPKDYLRLRLTGNLATDASDASGTLLYDIQTNTWHETLLAQLSIPHTYLPPIQGATQISGRLNQKAATALGLPSGIPVVTGAADTACSLLGAGLHHEHDLLLTLSTGGQLVRLSHHATASDSGAYNLFRTAQTHAVQQPTWYHLGPILAAGQALQWLSEAVFGLEMNINLPRLLSEVTKVPAGAEGLLFLPYLNGRRGSQADRQAGGMLMGLRPQHGRANLTRAVLEGVALACQAIFQQMPQSPMPQRIILAGGGARSQAWQHIIANTFNLSVQCLSRSDQSALGAALLAGEGVGLFDAQATAAKWARYEPAIQPDPDLVDVYMHLKTLFERVYTINREIFPALQQLANTTSPFN